jgi:hypothetical protein
LASDGARIVTNTSNGTAELAAENERLREALDAARGEYVALQQQLDGLAAENQRLSEQLVAAEEQGAGLVKLYVSNRRLNEVADRSEALAAIQEIIISVVGCEEFAIFEAGDAGAAAVPLVLVGIDQARAELVSRTALERVLRTGEAYIAPPPGSLTELVDREDLTACVPLKAGGRVTGAIVLYNLLPHKAELDQTDHTLLELLSVEAARALATHGAAPAAARFGASA